MLTPFTHQREKAGRVRDQAARARRAAAAVTLLQLRRLFLDYADQCAAEADEIESGLSDAPSTAPV